MRIAEQRRLAADGAVWSRDPGRNRGRLWADATRLPLAMALNSAPFPGLNTTEQTFAIASMRQAGIDRAVRWAIICAFALLTVGASWFFLDRNNRAVTAQLLDRAGQIKKMGMIVDKAMIDTKALSPLDKVTGAAVGRA